MTRVTAKAYPYMAHVLFRMAEILDNDTYAGSFYYTCEIGETERYINLMYNDKTYILKGSPDYTPDTIDCNEVCEDVCFKFILEVGKEVLGVIPTHNFAYNTAYEEFFGRRS